MPALMYVRDLTADETTKIEKMARSRKEAARLVQRARVIWLSHQRYRVSAIASDVDLSEHSVRLWIKRFNDHGLPGLNDEPRSGRPATYTSEQISIVIETALTKPETLGLPFACWTLDRLAAYLHEQRGIGIKRSRIDELLIGEGLRWKMQETWFSERVDPDFAEKRGPSSRSTRSHLRVVS
jgi:transposase